MADRPTSYDAPIKRVDRQQSSGTQVSLKLQLRTKADDVSWYVVSWRDQYKPGGTNRRFYIVNTKAWAIQASLALEMLAELEQQGGLGENYDDLKRRPTFKVSGSPSSCTNEEGLKLLNEICLADEAWGENPFFVVLNDPSDSWRKIMIINRETGLATFRSTTNDETYGMCQKMGNGTEWFLDRSMQDANVQQAREFLKHLRDIVPTLS